MCFERARLDSLLKKSSEGFVLKGHDFSRAANLINIIGALAPEGRFSFATDPGIVFFQQAL
jgi:hypothetical protein